LTNADYNALHRVVIGIVQRRGAHVEASTDSLEHCRVRPRNDVVVPPPDEIETLYQLARTGNMQSLCARADYLDDLDARNAAFAQRLRALAESYQSKANLALVERCRAAHDATRTENPQQ
jgi:hypothetical protein